MEKGSCNNNTIGRVDMQGCLQYILYCAGEVFRLIEHPPLAPNKAAASWQDDKLACHGGKWFVSGMWKTTSALGKLWGLMLTLMQRVFSCWLKNILEVTKSRRLGILAYPNNTLHNFCMMFVISTSLIAAPVGEFQIFSSGVCSSEILWRKRTGSQARSQAREGSRTGSAQAYITALWWRPVFDVSQNNPPPSAP